VPRRLVASRHTRTTGDIKRSPSTRLLAASIPADATYGGGGRVEDTDGLNVKYGPSIKLGKLKLNLFGALFGAWEVFWGIVYWYPAMTMYGLLRSISSKLPGDFMQRIDPYRRVPICIAYCWGLLSMGLFGLWPLVEGRENLEVLREIDENGKRG
jgi:hypothetical protein